MTEVVIFLSSLKSCNRSAQFQALSELLDRVDGIEEKEKLQLLQVIIELYIQERDNDKGRVSLLEKCVQTLVGGAERMTMECLNRMDCTKGVVRALSVCRIVLESITNRTKTGKSDENDVTVLCFATIMSILQTCICNKQVRNVGKLVNWTRKEFSGLLLHDVTVGDHLCNYIVENGINSLCGAVVLLPLLQGVEKFTVMVQTVIVDQFIKRVTGASKAQPDLGNPLWEIFSRNLEQSQWEGADGIESQIIKAFKKSPESFCLFALNLIKTLNSSISMNGFCNQGGIALCVRVMKSEDLSIRHSACELLVKVLAHVTDKEIFMNSLLQLVDSLHGKFPGVATVSIPQDHHKIAILLSLIHLLQDSRVAKGESSPQRDQMLQQLKASWLKEKDLGLASLVATSVASLIRNVINSNAGQRPQSIVTFIETLKAEFEKAPAASNNVTRFSTLIFLVELMFGLEKSNYSLLTCFTNSLVNIIKDSLKKTTWSNDLTFALSILFELATVDKDLSESLRTLKVTNAVSSTSFGMFIESYRSVFEQASGYPNFAVAIEQADQFPISLSMLVNSISVRAGCISVINFFANYATIDRDSFVKLMAASEKVGSLREADDFMKEQLVSSKLNPAYELLLQVSLLSNRFGLSNVLNSLLGDSLQQHPVLSITWLFTTWNKLNIWSSQYEAAVQLERMTLVKQSATPAAVENATPVSSSTIKPLPNVAADVKSLVALAANSYHNHPLSTSESVLLILIVVLIVGHPLVSGNLNSSVRWLKSNLSISHIVFRDEDLTSNILASRIFQVSQSASENARLAAHRGVRLLCDVLPSSALNAYPVLNQPSLTLSFLKSYAAQILSSLNQDSIFHLTEEDQKIFNNPDQVIEEAMNEIRQKIQLEATEITNADRKKAAPRSSRKGTFGGDVVEDEEWAEKVRKEKAAKLIQASEATELESIKQKVYGKKNDLALLIEAVKHSFEAISSFSLLSEDQCRCVMTDIMANSWLWQYFAVEVVDEFARTCLKSPLQHILENPMKGVACEILAALRIAKMMSVDESAAEFFRSKELPSSVSRILRSLQPLCSQRKSIIYPSTLHSLYPIFAAIFEEGTSENAIHTFSVLERLWPSSEEILDFSENFEMVEQHGGLRGFVKDVLSSCLTILQRFPRIQSAVDKFLLKLSMDCAPLSNEEIAIVVGEKGLRNSEPAVRIACCEMFAQLIEEGGEDLLDNNSVCGGLWRSNHDDSPDVQKFCKKIWAIYGKPPSSESVLGIVKDLSHPLPVVRNSAAKALAHAASLFSSTDMNVSRRIIQDVQQLYLSNLPAEEEPVVEKPNAKATLKKAPVEIPDEGIPVRLAVASMLNQMAVLNMIPLSIVENDNLLISLLQLIIDFGSVDPAPEVRTDMNNAACALVSSYGKTVVSNLADLFEDVLGRSPTPGENLTKFDHRHAAAVIMLGSLGRHLNKDSPMLSKILTIQLEALKTPSESVQRAVSDCLTYIAQTLKTSPVAEETLEKLINDCLNAEKYGDRRGAAFGLSAFVKGLGIPCLKQHNVIGRLKEACSSGSIFNRQGALFAFECLADRLGLLFEPYIIGIVDVLLASFSHSSDHVRVAAQGATKIIMAKLSAHGVKQMLNPIIQALTSANAWKSRQEAIKMLGMMAHCAPKQLAASLPQIVPTLVEASFDAHPKVKEAAKTTMSDISGVIKNPEIAHLSPILLSALADPSNKTKDALEALLECEFMHSIDSPSLALVIPILGRALKDRGADLKRKASAITGNMMTMVSDPKALSPYLVTVVPGLKDCLLDPIPDVRASGAKALGTLYNGIGDSEPSLQDVLKWLLNTLKCNDSPVERSGAAQGLAEICGSARDHQKTEAIVQWVLGFKKDSDNGAREGMMWFLSFLPYTLREQFSNYISSSLPIILGGLSDENEGVREVAMRAGKVIVIVLGMNHSNELAPALMDGIFQEDWRIRASSLQLLGELLFLIGDAKSIGMTLDDDDDDTGNMTSSTRVIGNIRNSLGNSVTDSVLASVYIARADVAASVRQQSLQIWKTIVANTPRTLVEIMPTLIKKLVEQLSSDVEDLRLISGRSIGELVTKLGDKVLPAIVQPLQLGLRSDNESTRLGVCLGLAEVLTACTKKQAEDYIDSIISAVRVALCDPSTEVCSQAAKSFMILYKNVGDIAVNEIVPALLQNLISGGEQSDLAINGLKEIVSLKPRDMLEYLLPMFLVSPIQLVSTRALAAVLEVSGQFVHYYLGSLIPTLISELYQIEGKIETLRQSQQQEEDVDQMSILEGKITFEEQRLEGVKMAMKSLVASISSNGVGSFVTEIGKQIDHDTNIKRRKWGCWVTEQFFICNKTADYYDYVPILLKFIINRIADVEMYVLEALKNCFIAIANNVPLDALMNHVDFMRNCISSTASSARHKTSSAIQVNANGEFILPLFTIPKTLDPFLTIFLYGLSNGSVQVREISAEMIGDLATMTTIEVLKPTLIKSVGPLIRVVGERYPSGVKAAILKTLLVLLERGGQHLKAFAPQLQTTFVKALSDPLREVRVRGGQALGKLMNISLRVDPLLSELSALCLQTDSTAIRSSIMDATISVLNLGGDKATPAALEKVRTMAIKNLYDEEDPVRLTCAKCLHAVAHYLNVEATTDLLLDLLGSDGSSDEFLDDPWSLVAGKLVGLGAVLSGSGSRGDEMRDEIFGFFERAGTMDDRASIKVALGRAIQWLVAVPLIKGSEERKAEFKALAQTAVHKFAPIIAKLVVSTQAADIRINGVHCIKKAAIHVYGATAQHMDKFFPALSSTVKDIDLRVKYSADHAMKALSEGPASVAGAGSNQFQQYLTRADPEQQKFLKDYYRRIISQLADAESEEDN